MLKIESYKPLRAIKTLERDGITFYYSPLPQAAAGRLTQAIKKACGLNYDDVKAIKSRGEDESIDDAAFETTLHGTQFMVGMSYAAFGLALRAFEYDGAFYQLETARPDLFSVTPEQAEEFANAVGRETRQEPWCDILLAEDIGAVNRAAGAMLAQDVQEKKDS